MFHEHVSVDSEDVGIARILFLEFQFNISYIPIIISELFSIVGTNDTNPQF